MKKYTVLQSLQDSNKFLLWFIEGVDDKSRKAMAEKQYCWNCNSIDDIKSGNHKLK